MPDIVIRGFTPAEKQQIDKMVEELGVSQNQWAIEVVRQALQKPAIWQRYHLFASGTPGGDSGPAYVQLSRTEESLSDPRPFEHTLSKTQRIAVQLAFDYLKVNNRQSAKVVLQTAFQKVWEQRLE